MSDQNHTIMTVASAISIVSSFAVLMTSFLHVKLSPYKQVVYMLTFCSFISASGSVLGYAKLNYGYWACIYEVGFE